MSELDDEIDVYELCNRVLSEDHGHLGQRDGLNCRSCKGRARKIADLLKGSAVDHAALVAILCAHEPYRWRRGIGCRTCARRADRLIAALGKAQTRREPETPSSGGNFPGSLPNAPRSTGCAPGYGSGDDV